MTLQSMLTEPSRVPEPHAVQDYSDVLTQVATEGKTVIVSRNGADLAVVIPMEQLELVRELLARQEAENLAAQINWSRPCGHLQPPQEWFDDSDSPSRKSGLDQ